MKKYVFTALLLATMMTCGSVSAYAQASTNEIQETTQAAKPERQLTYGKIQSITRAGDTLQSIVVEDVKGNTVVYAVTDKTVFLNSGEKIKLDVSTLKEGDSVYFYHALAVTPLTAEAVICNIPMDTFCAKLHTVEELAINKDGTIIVTSDEGSIRLKADKDVVIKDYDTNNTLQISDVKIGSRFFTWYDAVAESYPARAAMKEMVILPEAKEAEKPSNQDSSKNKVTYEKENLPIINGVSFVPLRETATKLGLSVTWDAKDRVTKMESDTRSMKFMEGKASFVSSSKVKGAVGMTAPLQLGAAPFIDKTNVMYVPAEAFRALVGYDVTLGDDTITIAEADKK